MRVRVAVPDCFSMKPVRTFQCKETDAYRGDTPVVKTFFGETELKKGKKHKAGAWEMIIYISVKLV